MRSIGIIEKVGVGSSLQASIIAGNDMTISENDGILE